MSSIDPPESGEAEDRAYFLALEERFLALRGRTTLLAPADWQMAGEWRRRGVPLDLVIQVMEEQFARQRMRKSKRGISSLRYFRAAVAAAFDELLTLGAGASRPPVDLGPPTADRLAALAAALPETVPGAGRLGERIRSLTGDDEGIEVALGELDAELLESAKAALEPAARDRLEQRVESAIAAVAADLTEEERTRLRRTLRSQALRAELGLPALSLFSPAALAAGAGSESRDD